MSVECGGACLLGSGLQAEAASELWIRVAREHDSMTCVNLVRHRRVFRVPVELNGTARRIHRDVSERPALDEMDHVDCGSGYGLVTRRIGIGHCRPSSPNRPATVEVMERAVRDHGASDGL